MKLAERLVAYGVLALVAVLLLKSHDANVRAQALAEQRADSLATARQHLVAADSLRLHADSMARDNVTKLGTLVTKLGTRATVANVRADSLAGIAHDSGAAYVALKAVVAAQQDQIDALEKSVAIFHALFHSADSSATAWRNLANAATAQLTASLKRAAPRLACVGGAGVTAGLGGSAVGLGVTCGLRIT